MKWLTKILILLASLPGFAREVTVFSINKTLSMSSKDVTYKDYYLNGGTEEGFRKGMFVTAIRRVPVHDLSRNRSLGDIRVPIGKLKLIYVSKSISVARLDKLIDPVNLPATEYAAVMVGDSIMFGQGTEDWGPVEDIEPAKNESTKESAVETPKVESNPPPVQALPELPKTLPAKAQEAPSREPSREKPVLPSAKASEESKIPLKSPTKPDNSVESIMGPSADLRSYQCPRILFFI